jgi:hypothetical protein
MSDNPTGLHGLLHGYFYLGHNGWYKNQFAVLMKHIFSEYELTVLVQLIITYSFPFMLCVPNSLVKLTGLSRDMLQIKAVIYRL